MEEIEVLIFLLAFLEGNLSIIPTDALSLVAIIYLKKNLLKIFLINYIGNILGFLFGYYLGLLIRSGKINYKIEKIVNKIERYKNMNYFLIILSSLTPILPYSYFSVYAGFIRLNFIKTLILVIVFRFIRLTISLILFPKTSTWFNFFKKIIIKS